MKNVIEVKAELISSNELKPGDLFSYCVPGYWDNKLETSDGVGEKVYIRTYQESDEIVPVFRITLERKKIQE